VLYDAALHEPLTDRAWDDAWVRDAIARIASDAVQAYDTETFWPAQEWDAFDSPRPLTDVYCGAAGVVWALDELGAELDPRAAARTLERFREAPAALASLPLPEQKESSVLIGETGVAFVAWKLGADDGLADRLFELVRANVGNEANELMWGVPGTLLLARTMHERTGDARWRDAVAESEADVARARDTDGLWTQLLYGQVTRYLGPVHGFVGNAFALGATEDDVRVLRENAVHEDGYVNWPPDPGGKLNRLQWCHGAPGILATASAFLDEDLVVGGARLIWDAGPLDSTEKGAGICHGTAGNGYGLLKAFERTGDELWLERARAFAAHALEQVERLPPRYSLFTGGVGAALFAADCLDGVGRFPFVERF
jgi:Lanthionine synthetase C-like protein